MIGHRPHHGTGLPRQATRRALGLLVAVLALLLTWALPASACSCAIATVKDHVERADLIARATVTAIDRSAVGSSAGEPVVYVLSSSRVWKGPSDAALRVQSAASEASCGLEGIAVGDEVIVFATASTASMGTVVAPWSVNLCGGTAAATPTLAQEVTGILGAGTPAGTMAPSTPSAPRSTNSTAAGESSIAMAPLLGGYVIPIAVAVVLLACAVVAWHFASRRRS